MATNVDRRFVQTTDDFIADDCRQMQNLAPNYNKWLFSHIRPQIGRRILEVGSGIGTVTRQLLESAEFVLGIEPNKACAAQLDQDLGNHSKFRRIIATLEECDTNSLAKYQFDTVVCINVLEHIEDDIQALRLFASLLQPRGKVVLLVPGGPWAFGTIDVAVGHFRRYNKKMISYALRQAGFEVELLRYSNLIGLVGWFFNGHIGRISKQSDTQIRIFDAMVPYISKLERIIPPFTGMSLITVGRKADD